MNYGIYKNLEQLIMGRFHEDYSIYGDSIPELVHSYNTTQEDRAAIRDEITRFQQVNSDCMDAAFESIFGHDCDPTLWGHTTASFLDELKRLLSE